MTDIPAFITGLLATVIPGFGDVPPPQYHGYVEADYVYIAPASAGRIDQISVKEGDVVDAGQVLFALEADQFSAALRAAEAREAVAEATWRNLETGSREEEIEVIRASLSKAEADLELAEMTLTRSSALLERGVVSKARVDADRSTLEAAKSQVAQLQAQLDVAELPARDAQIVAAEASLDAARADADKARLDLNDRRVTAPASGLIDRIYYRAGEVASVGAPVMSLLPPGVLKARFFVPETDRATLELGQKLAVSCDGCPNDLTATLTYMASDPQHTPPIIYSRDERARLVFMAEANLDGETVLLPGQPVTVELSE